jgi:thioredoxin 1
MRVSRWVIVAVVLAVAAVVVAKEAIRSRGARQAAEARSAAATAPAGENETARPAPRGAAAPASERKGAAPLPGSKLEASLKNGRVTMADFGKGWCVPCKAMVPVLEQAAGDYSGKANIVLVDMEQYDDLARMFRITVMPTQIFFDAKGHEVARHIGYMNGEDVEKQLAALGVKH